MSVICNPNPTPTDLDSTHIFRRLTENFSTSYVFSVGVRVSYHSIWFALHARFCTELMGVASE